MPKIDKFYIDSAKRIRKEFVRLSKELDPYKKDATELSEYLNKTAKELEKYGKNLDKNINIKSIEKFLMEKLNSVEVESKKLSAKINPINEAIENLRKEEVILYNAIKHKYPNIPDEELKKIIAKELNEPPKSTRKV